MEHFGELFSLGIVRGLIRPRLARVAHIGGNAGELDGDVKLEDGVLNKGGRFDGTVEDGVDARTRALDAHALADAVRTSCPAGVDEVCVRSVLFKLFFEKIGVAGGVERQKGGAEAGAEGSLRLRHAALSSCYFSGVSAQKVVHCLLGGKLRYGRKHAKGIACEKDDVVGVTSLLRLMPVFDVVDRVADAAVLRFADVVVVGRAVIVFPHVFEERVFLDRSEDLGLVILREINCLGVAAALKVEDAIVVPAVLVVADEVPCGVSGEGGLAGAR